VDGDAAQADVTRRWVCLGLLAAALAACRAAPPPPRSLDPRADVVVPYPVAGGGQVRFTVHPRYDTGQPITLELDITAGTVAIRGPLSGRVLASGLEGERTVRMLMANDFTALDVKPGGNGRVTVVWDGRDGDGRSVQAETYSLSLDFVIGDQAQRLGSVLDVRAP
jgi:hypothetical protein